MGEAAINLAFLGVSSYIVGRDIYSRLPSLPKTPSGKRFRGEPGATVSMDDEVCDPATLPPRTSGGGPRLSRPLRAAVKGCCESLLEAKYSLEQITGVVPTAVTAARVTCLNDLQQGTSAGNRLGNRILMKYLQVEGVVYLNSSGQSDLYRLIIVIDHECYGSLCTYAQYTQGTPAAAIYSLPSLQTVGKSRRFTTLVDKTVALNRHTPTGASGTFELVPISLRVPLNSSAFYSGNAGTYSDLVRNSICMLEVSSGGTVVADLEARLVFLDG